MEVKYPIWFASLTGLLASLLGGFDYILKALLIIIVIDFLTGIVSAGVFHKSKYGNGISSNAMVKGAVRKIFTLVLVVIANVIDKILGIDYVRNAVVMYFIATEGISILENMVHMGVQIPSFLTNLLETFKEKSDEGKTN